ncbi:putative rRNA maturation factor [Entomoplasma freundtii]|uniref:Endoribonuclease YbeY n=1 Tax=Entomoplasma freundtii TaxID=74700 RepID=A0A2K8NRH8_9MOLU|nr:rRNA maturation RNase YbeY [Entomoplasma freundtii]ATZ16387.1 16S rRNA maturation RNase YbeY [Entomoplasma freundtii]TDY56574.1 putative rRNA maturation factor [Entomoplasma freundtii]
MLEISFVNDTNINMAQWEKLADQIIGKGVELLNLHQDNLSLTVQFVTEEKAQNLNHQYRQKNYIPDVLSFPLEMNPKEVQATGFWEIGDIIICFDEAQRKAGKYNHTLEEEMAFLITHGFLHLLGYDHETSLDDEKKMFGLQDEILEGVGLRYEIRFAPDDYLELEQEAN